MELTDADILPLRHMRNLTDLNLGGNQISDLTPVKDLTNLRALRIWYNKIEDLSPIAGLVNLTRLEASRNNIRCLSPIAGLTGLTYIHAEFNNITDISPLRNLTRLNYIYLRYNKVRDWSPVGHVRNAYGRNLQRLAWTSNLRITGSGEFTRKITDALDLTKERYPEGYEMMLTYLYSIEQTAVKNENAIGGYVYLQAILPRCYIYANITTHEIATLTAVAGIIYHEAYHIKHYNDFRDKYGYGRGADYFTEYTRFEAEMAALLAEIEFLRKISAPAYEINRALAQYGTIWWDGDENW
jgi:hypothetical protein